MFYVVHRCPLCEMLSTAEDVRDYVEDGARVTDRVCSVCSYVWDRSEMRVTTSGTGASE